MLTFLLWASNICFPILCSRFLSWWHIFHLCIKLFCQCYVFFGCIFDLNILDLVVLTQVCTTVFSLCATDVSLDADATRKLLRVQRYIQVELRLSRNQIVSIHHCCIPILFEQSFYHFSRLFLLIPRWFTLRTETNCLSCIWFGWFVHLSLQSNDLIRQFEWFSISFGSFSLWEYASNPNILRFVVSFIVYVILL